MLLRNTITSKKADYPPVKTHLSPCCNYIIDEADSAVFENLGKGLRLD